MGNDNNAVGLVRVTKGRGILWSFQDKRKPKLRYMRFYAVLYKKFVMNFGVCGAWENLGPMPQKKNILHELIPNWPQAHRTEVATAMMWGLQVRSSINSPNQKNHKNMTGSN